MTVSAMPLIIDWSIYKNFLKLAEGSFHNIYIYYETSLRRVSKTSYKEDIYIYTRVRSLVYKLYMLFCLYIGCWLGGEFYLLGQRWSPVIEPYGLMVCVKCQCASVCLFEMIIFMKCEKKMIHLKQDLLYSIL